MKRYTIENCPNGLNGIYKIDFPNGKSYIGEINQGRKFKKENLEYPLRLRQKSSKRK